VRIRDSTSDCAARHMAEALNSELEIDCKAEKYDVSKEFATHAQSDVF
jgi:hypothetical protein